MFYTQDRDKLRQHWADVWKKARNNEPMDALETLIARVIEAHPEYHALLDNEHHLANEYLPEMGETNPFLHMGMHLAIQEQVVTDRPAGIRQLYENISEKTQDFQKTEHIMMDCLGEALWQAQKEQKPADETAYLNCVKHKFQTMS
jgi:hypothetical protein